MTLSPMIGMDGDRVDEGTGGPLGTDQHADRVGAREGDHAAAAPDLKVADRPLERGRRHGRLVGKVRSPAAIQRIDEKRDVVRAAEAVCRHQAAEECRPEWKMEHGTWKSAFKASTFPCPICRFPWQGASFSTLPDQPWRGVADSDLTSLR